jgi:cytochrome c oxidase subunit 2
MRRSSFQTAALAAITALPAQFAAAADETVQTVALSVFLLAGVTIIGVFVWVARTTSAPRDADIAAAYRLRRVLLLCAAALLLIVLGFTLPRSPYAANGTADRLVYATALQFAFVYSNEPVANRDDLGKVAAITDLEIPAGGTVEFRVTSLDVNHNFAIYDEAGVLVAQVQAMPGYVNRLRLQLDEPGRYTVLCLEYCGLAHHVMSSAFTVTAQAGTSRG